MPDIQQYSVSIKYKTEGAEKAAKDSDKIKDSLGKLKQSTGAMQNLGKELGKVGGFVATAGKVVKVAAVAGAAALTKMGQNAFKLSKQMGDYIETVNLFRASMGGLADEATAFVNKGEDLLGLDPSKMMDAISSFQNLSEGFGIASDRAYIMSKNLTQLSGDLSSFANISFEAAQKKLMSGFSGQVMPLRKYGIALDQASLQELAYSLGIEQRVKTMTRAQKTELIYYQIMKSTQKMQGDLGRTIMSPANSLRVLQTEFTKLARAVGSIFIPIMMRIIPVIRAVTQILTKAAQAIARFFGFDIADYTADLSSVGNLLEGVGEDIDGIGDAAGSTTDKLNKMLMPFDELNNITTSSKSSGGGSGTGGVGAGGSLGIDLPEYDMFASLDKSFNEMIANGDWFSIAKTIAEKLNWAMESIPWDKIKEKAGEMGKNLAEFLNIGIKTVNWRLFGQTFAEGINTIVEFAYNFVTTFNWKEFGLAISNTINGFFEKVNWEKVGQTLSTGVEGAFTTLLTTIENLNVNKIEEAIKKLVTNINWLNIAGLIGKLLAYGIIKSPFFNIPYLFLKAAQEVFNTIVGWINSIEIKVPDWIPGIGGKSWSPKIREITVGDDYEDFLKTMFFLTDDYLTDTEERIGETKEYTVKTFEEIEDKSFVSGFNTNKNYSGAMTEMSKNTQIAIDKIKSIFPGLDQSQETKKSGESNVTGFNSGAYSQIGNTDTVFGNIISTVKSKLHDPEEFKRVCENNMVGFYTGANNQKVKVDTAFGNIISSVKSKLNDPEALKQVGINDVDSFGSGANSQTKTVGNIFSKISSVVKTNLNVGPTTKQEGSEAVSEYGKGAQSQRNPLAYIFTDLKNTAISLKNPDSYTWGQDMLQGFINGINSKKRILTNTVSGLVSSISSFLHFSRPDKGPLRDYETWMPDMIKGLNNSLIKAMPQLNNTVMQMAEMIADSVSEINLPEISQSIYASASGSQVVGQIGNKTNAANSSVGIASLAEETYSAVSKALADNSSNNRQQTIVVNVGNREIYRGYGTYKDEQSNMLGVNT